MSCATPLPTSTLVDYWSGELVPALAEAVEAHVFDCAACAARLERLAALADGVAAMVRAGQLQFALTQALVEQLAADGARLRHYEARPGDHVMCGVGERDDYIITWLDAEFTPGAQVDLEVVGLGPDQRHADVLVDRSAGSLVLALPGDVARALPGLTFHMRLLERDGTRERVLGDFVFEHSPHRL
ncbi:MAG: zf-HC2 domain-containing protein [Myxococcota bacterium]